MKSGRQYSFHDSFLLLFFTPTLPSIFCAKRFLLANHLLRDLIVSYRNIFIQDVILFPWWKLFIKEIF